MKNGTATQKVQMQALSNIPYQQAESLDIVKEISKQVASGIYNSLDMILGAIANVGGELLSSLFAPVYSGAPDIESYGSSSKT